MTECIVIPAWIVIIISLVTAIVSGIWMKRSFGDPSNHDTIEVVIAYIIFIFSIVAFIIMSVHYVIEYLPCIVVVP